MVSSRPATRWGDRSATQWEESMTRGKKRFWIVLGVVLVLAVAGVAVSRRLPSKSVLVLEVSGAIEEQRPLGGLAVAAPSVTLLHNLNDAIDAARDDSRITGLVFRITSPGAGW